MKECPYCGETNYPAGMTNGINYYNCRACLNQYDDDFVESLAYTLDDDDMFEWYDDEQEYSHSILSNQFND